MIQSAQVASKFTLFTHHAKTFPNLVTALRNSMLRTGVFKDEKTAEEQVVQVLNFDIHLIKDFRGRRYIERITECIPVEEKNEYTFDHRKEKTLEGKFDKFFDNATIYDTYVLTNPITPENIKGMRENMNDRDMIEFDKFLERVWGIKPPKMPRYDENGMEIKDLDEGLGETVQVSADPITRTQKVDSKMQSQEKLRRQAQFRRNSGTGEIRRRPKDNNVLDSE